MTEDFGAGLHRCEVCDDPAEVKVYDESFCSLDCFAVRMEATA